jgi:hypothetical protein
LGHYSIRGRQRRGWFYGRTGIGHLEDALN